MTTSGLMSIGLRAMLANSSALQVTGHNIANANTVGYSRQETVVETATGQFTGAGFFGKGSDVVDVRRASDQFLTAQAQATKALAAMDETRSGQLQQLQEVFPAGDTGLGSAMGSFLNTMVDLANKPSDGSARQVVLARAADVAARFSSASARLDVLQAGVRSDLQSSAATVNSIASRLADLNQQIAAVTGFSQKPNDLLDQRDSLVSDLGKLIQVTTLPASDGTLGVFIAGGQRLVLGREASQLQVVPDSNDPSRAALAVSTQGNALALESGMLTGGSMAGLVKFQNSDLVDARNQLGQMATAFAYAINDAQARGLNLGDPPGPGSELFAVGKPLAIASTHNLRDASGQNLTQASVGIADASLLQASDYTLTRDPTGASDFIVTRLSDGLARGLNQGGSIDGFTVSTSGASLQNGDSFLLRPVGAAATGMKRVLDDPAGVAAASPLMAVASAANTGTASVASLAIASTAVNSQLKASITFTSDSGDYTWQLTDAISGGVVSSGSATWQAGQPITLNSFELSLNGVPKSGDQLTVSKTQYPATSNGNALQMAALRDQAFVGRTVLGDGSIAPGATVTDAYANTMADIGVRVQSAKMSSQISAGVSTQADAAVAARTGVNLDEEAARLIQYQQSYQAAAKVLQIAQTVFDTLLQLKN